MIGGNHVADGNKDAHSRHRERRLDSLIARLPQRVQAIVHWLRQPSSRWVRIPVALLLMAGGCLGFLPVLGFWMLPLGIVLLAEDLPPVKRAVDRVLASLERRWPHWFERHERPSVPPPQRLLVAPDAWSKAELAAARRASSRR